MKLTLPRCVLLYNRLSRTRQRDAETLLAAGPARLGLASGRDHAASGMPAPASDAEYINFRGSCKFLFRSLMPQ